MIPETNFPHTRIICAIQSNIGSCLIIPREGDLVRLYVQLSDNPALDSSTGRVDCNRMSPEKIVDVGLINS
jgi:phenol 2-monooxygenase (NADPH)